jgi:hypothetical protein
MKRAIIFGFCIALFAGASGVAQAADDPPPSPVRVGPPLESPPLLEPLRVVEVDMTPPRVREYVNALLALRAHEVAEADAERIALKLTSSEFGLWVAQYPTLAPLGLGAVFLLQGLIIIMLVGRPRQPAVVTKFERSRSAALYDISGAE